MIRDWRARALILALAVSAAHAQPGEPPIEPSAEPSEPPSEQPSEEGPAEASEAPSSDPPPFADPIPEPERLPDTAIEAHRTPFDTLVDRAIGRTSRPVRYDWRKATVEVGLSGALPAELNNFQSWRAGAFARVPVSGLLLGVEASYVWVYGTDSTDRLALTPYRQPGRPDRIEVDLTLAFPLAEGIVTAWPGWFPSAELVLQSHLDVRYLLYTGAFDGYDFTDTARALFSGSLSDRDLANLESDRLPGMQIDRGRYAILAGLGADLYFQSGLFFSHKLLVAVPLLAAATESELYVWLELHLLTGISF